jgi:hypothetical protein
MDECSFTELENIAKYAINTSKDMRIIEGERRNAGYLKKKIMENILILDKKRKKIHFSTSKENKKLIQFLIQQLILK